MTMLSLDRDADWKVILALLPKNFEELAHEHKQLEVQYGNAKITSAQTLLRFILLHVGAELPLRQTVAVMQQAGGPSLAPMRLHKKMCRAVPYLQALVDRMVSWRSEAKPEQWAGYSLVAVDSSTVCRPGAKGPTARLHTKLRISDVSITAAEVTDCRGGDSFSRFFFEQHELVLADRGYCHAASVARVREQGADVLMRLNRGAMPMKKPDGSKLDVLATVRAMRDGAVLDIPAYIEHDDDRIGIRFIATRLPPSEAQAARKRLRLEHGSDVSEESLEAAAYVMLVTTVPRERMNASRCLEAYTLRWQIELQFKRWKSLCGFDRLPNFRDDTVVAWLYAKLLLGLVLDRISSIRSELSPPARYESQPRGRRRKTVGAPAVEADERPLSDDCRRAAAVVAA